MRQALIEKLSALSPMSREAIEELENSLERLANLAVERLSVQYRFRCSEPSKSQIGFVEDAARQFGGLLDSVYRFGIYPVLAEESAWYISTFVSRGIAPDAFASLVDSWIIAIRGTVRPPASDELARPLSVLRENSAELVEKSVASTAARRDLEPRAKELLERLLEKDFAGAERLLQSLGARGWTAVGILDGVLMPCIREIGARWEHNEIGVADEHGASEILRRLVSRLGSRSEAKAGLRAVVACVPGDEHELGLSALAAYLESEGWEVVYLGRSMPAAELVGAVGENAPRVVFLSLSMIAFLRGAVEVAAGIRKLNLGVKIVFGGQGASAASAVLLEHADAVARSFREAHETAIRLVGDDA